MGGCLNNRWHINIHMGLNLKSLRKVTNGFSRGCYFSVGFPDWRGFGMDGGISSKIAGTLATPILNAFVSGMEMPSKTIVTNSVDIQVGLPKIKVASDVLYDDWTVTFYSDELLLIRYFLLQWMEMVHNTKTHSMGTPYKYKSNLAYGAVLSPQNIPVQVYSFKGLYPTKVSGVKMDQQDNTILKFDVTFSYDYFKVNEPLGLGLAFAFEYLGSAALNQIFTRTTGFHKRKINAPMGVSVKIPF